METTTIPWQAVTKEGYGKLDLQIVTGPPFGTMLIVRQRPKDENAGAFVVYHNENRISERFHSTRAEAIGEAERYFYANPIFAGSANAAMIAATMEQGRQAYRAGQTLYQNPFTGNKSVERAQWAEGWLQAYTIPSVQAAVQKMANVMNPIAAQNDVLKKGIEFALSMGGEPDTKAIEFLREWATSSDPEGFNAKYPEWPAFRDGTLDNADETGEAPAETETPTE